LSFPSTPGLVCGGEPLVELTGQPGVERFTEEAGKCWGTAIGRNRDGHIVTPHNTPEICRRVGRIIYGIHEYPALVSRHQHLLIDLTGCGSHSPPRAIEIGSLEALLDHADGAFQNFRPYFRRNDGDVSAGRQQRVELARCHRAATHDDHAPGPEVEERWKHQYSKKEKARECSSRAFDRRRVGGLFNRYPRCGPRAAGPRPPNNNTRTANSC
jgi:hypothetical protein